MRVQVLAVMVNKSTETRCSLQVKFSEHHQALADARRAHEVALEQAHARLTEQLAAAAATASQACTQSKTYR